MVVVQKFAPYRLTFSLRNFPIKNDKIKISRFMCQTFSIYVSSYSDNYTYLYYYSNAILKISQN